jgi:predicted metal-dependent phosphoesterase TrpH
LIDLHTHTTASDGCLAPTELVRRAAAGGIRTLSVTDHDTVGGLAESGVAAAEHGLELVAGIEITAVYRLRDVHILGYFFDPSSSELTAFLSAQREDRVRRVRAIATRLAALGVAVDVEDIIARAAVMEGHAVGRPAVARALVAAGHASSTSVAFDRWIGDGKAAFVPRTGPSPEDVVGIIARAGGLSSLAHPGLLGRDDLIPSMAEAGLGAIEAYHPEHDRRTTERYKNLARKYQLAVSGGSDYHADDRDRRLGSAVLPPDEYRVLADRAAIRRARGTKNDEP